MPQGHPDWDIVTESVGLHSTDVAELAVRLGSNYRISRTGKVLIETTFNEDAVLWNIPYGTTLRGETYLLDGLFRPGCLRIYDVAATGGSASFRRNIPYIFTSLYGIEFGFKYVNNPNNALTVELDVGGNNLQTFYNLKFNLQTRQLMLQDVNGTYQNNCEFIDQSDAMQQWMIVKIIYDLNAQQILQVRLNDTVLPFVDTGRYTSPLGLVYKYIQLGLAYEQLTNNVPDFRVSHLILTFDESRP